jgi:hypothetical protein
MSQSLTWSFDVAVSNGPRFSASQALTFDAYDRIDIVVPAATAQGNDQGGQNDATAGTATVEVQPGGQDRVQFLLITSSVYDGALTLEVDGREPALTLDAPILLSGPGAVRLLGQTQNKFKFTNNLQPFTPATVSILVGRKATA